MISTGNAPFARIAPRQSARRRSDWVLGVTGLIEGWIERYRQRRALLELSDHMLKDIGISRVEAEHEGRKPFWRA